MTLWSGLSENQKIGQMGLQLGLQLDEWLCKELLTLHLDNPDKFKWSECCGDHMHTLAAFPCNKYGWELLIQPAC